MIIRIFVAIPMERAWIATILPVLVSQILYALIKKTLSVSSPEMIRLQMITKLEVFVTYNFVRPIPTSQMHKVRDDFHQVFSLIWSF